MSMLHCTSGGATGGAGGATEGKLDASDVFSTYLYTGNGSTQTINNGIDLAGEGGMVWCKDRSATSNTILLDTNRAVNAALVTNLTNPATSGGDYIGYANNGFSWVGGLANANISGRTYVSWTFRKAPKFFDVVTWTGNGVAGRQIAHNLGIVPGMVIVKATSTTGTWYVYHRSMGGTHYGKLDGTESFSQGAGVWSNTSPSDTVFTTGTVTNYNGQTYVAYLFAHDTSADGIIQCGSFTTDGSGKLPNVNLGWEPQYLMLKASSGVGNWIVYDTMRGLIANPATNNYLMPNTGNAEDSGVSFVGLTSTGFSHGNASVNAPSSTTYIYMAIRRPNKVPTSGTEVYNAIARTGTGAAATVTGVGFAPDMVLHQNRSGNDPTVHDKLRGATQWLKTNSTVKETATASTEDLTSWTNNGVLLGTSGTGQINYSGVNYINYFFRRAPGFFDVVCYTGTSGDTVLKDKKHNLGRVPEMMIVKVRNNTGGWYVYHKDIGNTAHLILNSTSSKVTAPWTWENTTPTETSFHVSSDGSTNTVGYNYVAYLFASLPGISKVGSYTGNGISQTINCGFSTGARFILIKRTDSTGDWYIWDSVRGIVAANDPHLSLNSPLPEVTTDDSIDPAASGFIVNQNTATNINVLDGTYIFLAIA